MAQQYSVDIIAKVLGQSSVDKLNRSLNKVDGNSKKAALGLKGVGSALAGIGAIVGTAGIARFIIGKTAELETQTRSLKVLTGELSTAKRIIGELQSFAAVTPFTSSGLIDTAKRLRAFGVETEKLVDTTKRLADVAGATGAELNGVATAYGQIQAKGRLQTEELLQLQERGIDLATELRKMYGLTGEEFSKALQKGQISAEAVEVALQRVTDAGGKYADGAISQSDTLAGKFSTLQDNIEQLARTIGEVLSPALKLILTEAIAVVNSINNALAAGRRIQQFGINAQQRNDLFQQAGREAEELARLRGGGTIDSAEFTRLRDERFRDLLEKYGYETGQIEVEVTPVLASDAPTVPDLLNGNSGSGSKVKAPPSAGKTLEERLRVSKELLANSEAQLRVAQSLEGVERIEAQLSQERLDIQTRYADLLRGEGDAVVRNNLLLAQQNELIAADMQAVTAINNLREGALGTIEEENAALQASLDGKREEYDLEKKIEAIVKAGKGAVTYEEARAQVELNQGLKEELRIREEIQSIMGRVGQEAVSLFDTLINGTEDFNKALENTLRQLSSFLLQMGFNAIGNAAGQGSVLNSLFGSRAMGGPVSAGQPYVVGERGPELFVPSQSGGVVANSKMGGGDVNYVQNIYITDDGSKSDGDAGELGRLIESSVVGIIQREKRPGGMLG